jgi:membrane protease YdiL (CAAX protease family)
VTAIISIGIFLGVVGAFIPIAAWLSSRALDQGVRIERVDFYLETVITQTALVVLALWVWRTNDLPISFAPTLDARGLFWAVVLLTTALVVMVVTWTRSGTARRDRYRMILPETRHEKVAWAGVSLAAGIAEEIVYRGVLFGLLLAWSGSWLTAALTAAALFGVAHLVQGWKAVPLVMAYGLLFQILYAATGSLFLPIAVHVMYDLIAGLMISRWSRADTDEHV